MAAGFFTSAQYVSRKIRNFTAMTTPVTDKPFAVTAKELVYIFSLILALVGQWYSQKATLNEVMLTQKADVALLRLEIQVLKSQIEELKQRK
jgi:hypothetical protein